MPDNFSTKATLVAHYNDYQRRYAKQIRESDKILLRLIAERPQARSLLDIGCSTGNLLAHIRQVNPSLALTGGDITETSLEQAKSNPNLVGAEIRRMDMTSIDGKYDIIVGNAITSLLDDELFGRAMQSVGRALNRDGTFIGFEWMHPFETGTLEIRERTKLYPEGLYLYFRPSFLVRECCAAAGMIDIRIDPFEIPIDLPFPGFDQVTTYTRKDAEGKRMCFRGIIYQPWAFVTARKS